MIDSHAHLDFSQFDEDRGEVIRRAFSSGVKKIINVGCNIERARASVELAGKYENVYAAVGVHPTDVEEETKKQRNKETGSDVGIGGANPRLDVDDSAIQEIREIAKHPKVVAIGEIGLDYFHMDSNYRNINEIPEEEIEQLKNRQKEFFIAQLELARELNLPVIIHCRPSGKEGDDAYEDVLEILKNTPPYPPLIKGRNKILPLDKGEIQRGFLGVIHCFSGNREQARQFLDLGFYISFTGNITYSRGRKSSAPTLQDVVREVPLDKILIETDCPFLSPIPHRGMRNEPAFVKCVADKIAGIKNIDIKEVEEITDENAERLFGI